MRCFLADYNLWTLKEVAEADHMPCVILDFFTIPDSETILNFLQVLESIMLR